MFKVDLPDGEFQKIKSSVMRNQINAFNIRKLKFGPSNTLSILLVTGLVLSLLALIYTIVIEDVFWSKHYLEFMLAVFALGALLSLIQFISGLNHAIFTVLSAVIVWIALGFSAEIFGTLLFWLTCLGYGFMVAKVLRWQDQSITLSIILGYLFTSLCLIILAYTPFNNPIVYALFFILPASFSLVRYWPKNISLSLKTVIIKNKFKPTTVSASAMYYLALSLVLLNSSTPELGSDAVNVYRSILAEIMSHGSFQYSPEITSIGLVPLAGIWPQSFVVTITGSLTAAKILNGSLLVMTFVFALNTKMKTSAVFLAISLLATLPIISNTTLSAFYDNSLIFLGTGLIVLVEALRQFEKLNSKSLFIIGLFAALMVLTKYTTMFVAPAIAVFILWRLNKQPGFKQTLTNIIYIASGGLLVFGSFLVFVYFQTGNPFFPFYSSFFENPYVSYDFSSPHQGYLSILLLWDLMFEAANYAQVASRNGVLGALSLIIMIPALAMLIIRRQSDHRALSVLCLCAGFAGLVLMSYFQNNPRYLLILFPFFAVSLTWFISECRSSFQNTLIIALAGTLLLLNFYANPRAGFNRVYLSGIFAQNHADLQMVHRAGIHASDKLNKALGRNGNVLFMNKNSGFIGRSYTTSWYDELTAIAFQSLDKSTSSEVEAFLSKRNVDAVVASSAYLNVIDKQAPGFKSILNALSISQTHSDGIDVYHLMPDISFSEKVSFDNSKLNEDGYMINLVEISDFYISFDYSCSDVSFLRFIDIRKDGTWEFTRDFNLKCDGSVYKFEHPFRKLNANRNYRILLRGKDGQNLQISNGSILSRRSVEN